MAVLTVMADYENVFNSYLPQGKYSLVVVSVVMFVLVAIVLAESVRSWIRLSKTVPQDYRTQDEIEEQTKKNWKRQEKQFLLYKETERVFRISGFYVSV